MDLPSRVREILEQLHVSKDKLEVIRDKMVGEFQRGLDVGRPVASIAMLPTYVPALPDGSEAGKYLALDLSGKNLRIMLLELHGRGVTPVVHTRNFVVCNDLMVATGSQLFDFIVCCVTKFLSEYQLLNERLSLGFVFSYPCEMKSIRNANLLWWTKGFNVQDCLNRDVGDLLQDALDRHGVRELSICMCVPLSLSLSCVASLAFVLLKVTVKAVMNDTVGQLAASSYINGADCVIAVVIGYGCNASYLEEVANIKKFDASEANYHFPNMVIDTEWEEFGRDGELDFIRTPFDIEVDHNSVHKGKQIIDKLTGAYFLGELVRVIIDQLAVEGLMFGGDRPELFTLPDTFPTKYIAEILSGDGEDESKTKSIRRILEELRIPIHAPMDYIIIRDICSAVASRSASIVAAAIAALMKRIRRPKLIIGVGGALNSFLPNYHDMLKAQLNDLVPPDVSEWDVLTSEYGSCQGAALIAATAEKMHL
ncbi:unnamed protein product [Soboliphyme baturini]|uniref:Phosphotransferase n=1 Tax=Soboliphyme baturini TaxID=241478 RepID=A0A183IZG6_9BILA|nr:unnamed protein product [Soboliphyme baturini]